MWALNRKLNLFNLFRRQSIYLIYAIYVEGGFGTSSGGDTYRRRVGWDTCFGASSNTCTTDGPATALLLLLFHALLPFLALEITPETSEGLPHEVSKIDQYRVWWVQPAAACMYNLEPVR